MARKALSQGFVDGGMVLLLVNEWSVNSGGDSHVRVSTFSDYEKARAYYLSVAPNNNQPQVFVEDQERVVVEQEEDPVTGFTLMSAREEGYCKRPRGAELRIVHPIRVDRDAGRWPWRPPVPDGAVHNFTLRSYPDERTYQ